MALHDSTDIPAQILDVNSLPSLPQALVDLIDECNKKDINIQKLGEAVARDVFLSTRVLQLVNSAFIGARNTFSDIVQAVIYLGVDTTRNLAVSVAVHETFSSLNIHEGIDLLTFWRHSFLTAVLAKNLSTEIGGVHPSEAYLIGLLHDIGKLLLLCGFPEQYKKIAREKTETDLESREKEVLKITHSEAAALLIRHWHLQETIAEAVFFHHLSQSKIQEKKTPAKILYCANLLSNCPLPNVSSVAEKVCDTLNIGFKSLQSCIQDSLITADEITQQLGIKIKKGSNSVKGSLRSMNKMKKSLNDKVLTFSRLNGFLDNLVKADNLDRVYQVVETSVHILFAVDGCLFLLPDESGGFNVCGSAENVLLSRAKSFRIGSDDTSGMLSDCLSHLTMFDSFSYAEENELSSIDKALVDLFRTDGIMMVPTVIAGQEPGVLILGVRQGESSRLYDGKETLLLLAGYSGMRFRLECDYRHHASRLASERVSAVTEVAKTLAHEISNPIATLQNYLAVLKMKLKDSSDIAADLEVVDGEIARIGEISDQLWNLSSQDVRLQVEPVNLNRLLPDVVSFFQQSVAGQKGVVFKVGRQEKLPIIMSNGLKIRQILGNLIKNAIEAIEAEGVVSVGAAVLENPSTDTRTAIMISVEDNGPGILLPNIDDVFRAGVTTKKGGHAGLGLAIAAKLVTQLGGEIQCEKRQQGGMTFRFVLPVEPLAT